MQNRELPDRPRLLAILVATMVLAALVVPVTPGCPDYRRSRRAAAIVEADGLAQATTAFQIRYGYSPPLTEPQLQAHIHAVDPHGVLDARLIASLVTLDESERIVFWLGGQVDAVDVYFDRPAFYDFDQGRFIDRDHDGFWEYCSSMKSVYQYDSTTARVSCDFSDDELVVAISPLGLAEPLLEASKHGG